MRSLQRKKNGGSHSAGNRARSKPTVACDFQRPSPVGTSGDGGHRDGGALRHASGRGNGFDQTATVPISNRRPADRHLFLWPLRSLPGTALQACPDRGGNGESIAPLLLM